MRGLQQILIVASVFILGTLGKRFEKCELATILETTHGLTREEVKNWVCIAEYESTFNSEAINHYNWDGSKDYGLFQLNSRYWCDDDYEKNECKIPCSALLDDDLTDDLACVKKVVKDTERWKGKGTGLTAWVVYEKKCQHKNLEEYMGECWSNPTDTNVINNRDESPQQPPIKENIDSTSGAGDGNSGIINLVRVPIMYQTFPYFQHLVNPQGYIHQQIFRQ